ncbi:hypothetical protein DPEC_G00115990 [Dallia pectoralis]|uniref:Uncharacterized protein n=1 Tax=Dallia pectoralis TaxID=75939 RepID=A0ACC2GU19_DALPE|nr:hypothetical protein DPEC_G00115990 [Dallia pectoralis]
MSPVKCTDIDIGDRAPTRADKKEGRRLEASSQVLLQNIPAPVHLSLGSQQACTRRAHWYAKKTNVILIKPVINWTPDYLKMCRCLNCRPVASQTLPSQTPPRSSTSPPHVVH